MIPVLAVVSLVRALSLPAGFTVDPEGAVPQIAFGANRTIAVVAQSTDRTERFRAVRWSEAGNFSVFAPLYVLTAPGAEENAGGNQDPNYRVEAAGVASAGGQLLVTASTNWSGAYSGESFEVQRWGRYSAARWPLPACVDSGDSVDQHAYGGDDDGRVALTIDRTGAGSFQVMQDDPEQFAPYAYVIRGSACRNLGRGIVQAVNGQWAAGYRPYLNGKIAPDDLNTVIQSAVAARWYGSRLRELGPGGADHTGHTYCPGVPHAVAWDRAGRRITLAPDSPRSVAYGVSDKGTVVGMLTDAKGRHFAFRWRNGVLQLLDDLPHPRGWRFESAYAVGEDGSIAGIGTLDGVPKVFIWRY